MAATALGSPCHAIFIAEAGAIETPHEAYALALFMQRYPEWPGTKVVEKVVKITYRHLMAAYKK